MRLDPQRHELEKAANHVTVMITQTHFSRCICQQSGLDDVKARSRLTFL